MLFDGTQCQCIGTVCGGILELNVHEKNGMLAVNILNTFCEGIILGAGAGEGDFEDRTVGARGVQLQLVLERIGKCSRAVNPGLVGFAVIDLCPYQSKRLLLDIGFDGDVGEGGCVSYVSNIYRG